MLRKSPSRWTLAAGVALVLCLLLVPVVWAAAIDVNGTCDETEWGDPMIQNEGGGNDCWSLGTWYPQYDMDDIYSVTESDGDLFIRFNTYSNVVVNEYSFVEVKLDGDGNHSNGLAGYEFNVHWEMQSGACKIQTDWDAGPPEAWLTQVCSGDTCCKGAYGSGTTCVEIFVNGSYIKLGQPEDRVYLYFDNATSPDDDDWWWDYDPPTAVELSSFTTCSERRPANEPGLTSFWPVGLLLGVVAVSAGGLVVRARKGLPR